MYFITSWSAIESYNLEKTKRWNTNELDRNFEQLLSIKQDDAKLTKMCQATCIKY